MILVTIKSFYELLNEIFDEIFLFIFNCITEKMNTKETARQSITTLSKERG
jgi:hypothetical protein